MDTGGAESAPQRASAEALRLRPLREDDEAAFSAAHGVMAKEDFPFGLGYEPGMPWGTYLRALEDRRHGLNLPPGSVPAAFLVADVAGDIVGRSSVRFELNEFLAREGGHIGYCVLPPFRRLGYATEILRQSLVIARAEGVGRVLVTCDEGNLGSIAVIESCGGRLDSVVSVGGGAAPKRRYWIG